MGNTKTQELVQTFWKQWNEACTECGARPSRIPTTELHNNLEKVNRNILKHEAITILRFLSEKKVWKNAEDESQDSQSPQEMTESPKELTQTQDSQDAQEMTEQELTEAQPGKSATDKDKQLKALIELVTNMTSQIEELRHKQDVMEQEIIALKEENEGLRNQKQAPLQWNIDPERATKPAKRPKNRNQGGAKKGTPDVPAPKTTPRQKQERAQPTGSQGRSKQKTTAQRKRSIKAHAQREGIRGASITMNLHPEKIKIRQRWTWKRVPKAMWKPKKRSELHAGMSEDSKPPKEHSRNGPKNSTSTSWRSQNTSS